MSNYLEVAHILECDERKMDLKVFGWQMVLNLQKSLFEMEGHNQGRKMTNVALGKGSLGRNKTLSISNLSTHD